MAVIRGERQRSAIAGPGSCHVIEFHQGVTTPAMQISAFGALGNGLIETLQGGVGLVQFQQ